MAGLYVHIPFCRKACRYCDFHFSVSLGYKPYVLDAIGTELLKRLDESENHLFSTIYVGGGTPSVLDCIETESLLSLIHRGNITDNAEISFEANPDDLTRDYVNSLLSLGINRLSIGIQSFNAGDLKLLRRSHSVQQCYEAIETALKCGFTNINVDLMYGIPGMSIRQFEKNLMAVTGYNIGHISAYHLTYEPGTVLDHWRKKTRIIPLSEDKSYDQFLLLRSFLSERGYDHYEISNFAKPGMISVHNSNYWRQVEYIGIGPSAHSYTGHSRRWNISSNKKYVENIRKGLPCFEEEKLSADDIYNEYLMTSLRTSWGIKADDIKEKFGEEKVEYLLQKTDKYLNTDLMENIDGVYRLTGRGLFLSDHIISDLFI